MTALEKSPEKTKKEKAPVEAPSTKEAKPDKTAPVQSVDTPPVNSTPVAAYVL